jgi:aminoglycoside phosphotransferase (APT) family kinase protein
MGGWLHDATPEQQRTAQQSAVDALARIHRLDWRSLGLDFLDRRELGSVGLDQELGYWRRYLDWASREGPLPRLEAAFAWCEANRPAQPGPAALNWGDARLGNIIYADDFTPAAVLDWEMALLGPPEIDLGWFLFIHETALMWLPDLPGFMERDALVARYEAGLGRAVEDLRFYEAWAGFRASAIRARMVQRDIESGRKARPDQRESNPIVTSLGRLVDLPA